MPHGPVNPGTADLLSRLADLTGASYALATSSATFVTAAQNTKGILLHRANVAVHGNSNSGTCQLLIEGPGVNAQQLLYAAVNGGGGNNAPNGAATALNAGLFIPPGLALRCVVGGAAPSATCSVHYTIES